ncbi:hypothetical protein [Streptomyces griseoflavus]
MGRSDLGLLVSLHGDPTARGRDAVRVAEEWLDGTLLCSRERGFR